jgi:hypothetical protein
MTGTCNRRDHRYNDDREIPSCRQKSAEVPVQSRNLASRSHHSALSRLAITALLNPNQGPSPETGQGTRAVKSGGGWRLRHANIKFKFVASGEAEIRIAFMANDGSWSAVGRDALNRAYFPAHQPTMNYGWLTETTSDDEYSRVVLHEFGHALGCIHEHQAPRFTRVWNKEAVYRYFSGSPNFWSKEDIDHNVLQKYSPKGMLFTKYDPKSIMLYDFDAALFTDGLGPTNSNKKLSPTDISFIKSLYP